MKILAINPGSTTTKIAIFEDCTEQFSQTIDHEVEKLAEFSSILDQQDFRRQVIFETLQTQGYALEDFDVFVGRGGLVRPISGGVYRVNEAMLADLRHSTLGEHASNLGGIIADDFARAVGEATPGIEVPAYIVNPVVVDELEDLARYSGMPELPRMSIFHALNHKSIAQHYARQLEKPYEELNLIVAHLGGGITVGAHRQGRVVDVNDALLGDGPFSPERAGELPSGQLAKLCYSGKYDYPQLKKLLIGKGGLVAYLGTNSAREVEERIEKGDAESRMCYEAMAYQVAKEIGATAAVLKGQVDAILLTGGLANSEMLCGWIVERVEFIAPVKIFPGEHEMEALAEGAYYATVGQMPVKEYTP
ncbi:MAG: butyrate kinase [Planctomycetia bacterium]